MIENEKRAVVDSSAGPNTRGRKRFDRNQETKHLDICSFVFEFFHQNESSSFMLVCDNQSDHKTELFFDVVDVNVAQIFIPPEICSDSEWASVEVEASFLRSLKKPNLNNIAKTGVRDCSNSQFERCRNIEHELLPLRCCMFNFLIFLWRLIKLLKSFKF